MYMHRDVILNITPQYKVSRYQNTKYKLLKLGLS